MRHRSGQHLLVSLILMLVAPTTASLFGLRGSAGLLSGHVTPSYKAGSPADLKAGSSDAARDLRAGIASVTSSSEAARDVRAALHAIIEEERAKLLQCTEDTAAAAAEAAQYRSQLEAFVWCESRGLEPIISPATVFVPTARLRVLRRRTRGAVGFMRSLSSQHAQCIKGIMRRWKDTKKRSEQLQRTARVHELALQALYESEERLQQACGEAMREEYGDGEQYGDGEPYYAP